MAIRLEAQEYRVNLAGQVSNLVLLGKCILVDGEEVKTSLLLPTPATRVEGCIYLDNLNIRTESADGTGVLVLSDATHVMLRDVGFHAVCCVVYNVKNLGLLDVHARMCKTGFALHKVDKVNFSPRCAPCVSL